MKKASICLFMFVAGCAGANAVRIAPELSWGPPNLTMGALLWTIAGTCAGASLAILFTLPDPPE